MKKFSSIILCLILLTSLLSMTGCGKESTSVPDSPTDLSTQEEPPTKGETKSIMVYSGAGLRKPVEELGNMFKEKTGIEVQFTYGNCTQLTNQILTVDKGDVLLPGDAEDIKSLREHDKIGTERPLVYHVPVLAVPQGNPADIKSLDDLKKPGIKIVLGDPETNPLGKLAENILTKKGIYEQVEQNVVTRAATVSEMFVYLEMKQVDASIIW
ncbi:MAG TPA: molybdate ABC transporter substrate-binding protein, partial [Oscillospiraceae bacterium]|nr:molybdate ABC transporter substrate-binding protein [Oscillospiraceae bacterium]